MRHCFRILAPAVMLVAAAPAFGAIKNLIPLKDVLATEEFIFAAKVEKIDPDKPSVIFAPSDVFKGKLPFQRLPVILTGDAEAKRDSQVPKLLKRLAPEMTVILFVHRQGKNYLAFAFTNGTWFQMLGQGDKPEDLRWSFNHFEPYLRRTFKGTTEELKKIVVDGLAGKSDPPKPDEKEPPGIGPEVSPQEKPKGPPNMPLGVIPTFVVIGPLAILATLFPTVFGGLALLMRRWMVSLSLTCLLSTLYFAQLLMFKYLQGTWLANATGMWLTFSALSVVSALWAARRYRKAVVNQEMDAWLPGKWDRIVLIGLSIVGLVAIGVALFLGRPILRYPWLDVVATFAPVWVTSVALVFYRGETQTTPGTSLEVIFLWSIAVTCGLVAVLEKGRSDERGRSRTMAADLAFRSPRLTDQPAWKFEPSGSGMILSSPTVHDGRIYVGALVGAGLSKHGRLYCIDADSGRELWSFDDSKGLRGVFSSACVAEGKVYFGEGFHEDRDCRVLCLRADNGERVWEFPTTSHTESAPAVVNGKLYIGAGDDGLYCLNAEDGKVIWQRKELHIDANPVVHDGQVFVASGVGDIYKTTLMLCLNAADGKEHWAVPLEYPSFAMAAVHGSCVFVGSGNGNFSVSDPTRPRGNVLCLDRRTGKRLWQFDAKDAVLCKPAVDETSVWLTSRDGFVYCIRRTDGRLRWKFDAKSPVVSSPVLIADGDGAVVRTLYVAANDGVVYCLDPDRGTPYWSLDLASLTGQPQVLIDGTPAIESRNADGVERRTLYIGFGTGKDLSRLSTSLPRLYRLEEEVK